MAALEEPVCLACERMRRALDAALLDLENAEVALRVERRKVKERDKLLAERDDAEAAGNDDAEAVFAYWKAAVAPRARSFKGMRRRNVLARLKEGYTLDDLMLAIDGARVAAGVSDKTGERFDDLELICRDPKITDSFIKRGAHHEARVNAVVDFWADEYDPLGEIRGYTTYADAVA